MKIVLLEPYFTGSHAAWATEYAQFSRHQVQILSLPGQFWKWRLQGGAITLAGQFLAQKLKPDLLLATDMLDLATFLALTRQVTADIPIAIYFHENQLTYPWALGDRDQARQRHVYYGLINYRSALAADRIFFNSHFHKQAFLTALPQFLKQFPDLNQMEQIEPIAAKSQVLPLGLNLRQFDAYQRPKASAGGAAPLVLWNHRWEFDKNPDEFFRALFILAERGLKFQVAILGECFAQQPEIFLAARKKLGDRIVQFGYVADFADYAAWLWRADILPVCSHHDFFGASAVQAMYCGCVPLLPSRLAYPEHIPEQYHSTYFYQDFEELVIRLGEWIENIARLRSEEVRDFVRRYDWGEIGEVYDEMMAKNNPIRIENKM